MITGVVLARNEAANIVACLDALRPHVEETILIDMASEDQTVALAQPLVDQVLHHPLVPDFDVARNLAISAAKYDWLWFVDADERIAARTGEVVRQLVRDHGHEFEALVIPFKSYFCGQWMQHCGWWPGYTMPRVLKRGTFQFASRLHGGVEVNGRQLRLPADPDLGVDHFSYRSVEHYLEKLNRYTSTEAGQLADSGQQWDWRIALREMVRDLWVYYEFNPGHLDRERGWSLSWLSGQYRWLSRAKLIDVRTKDPDAPPVFGGTAPETLDEVLDLWQRELAALRARHPRLPLGIVWRSPVYDPSGYADEARAFIKGLAQGERPLRVDEVRWSDRRCVLPTGDEALLRALARAQRTPQAIAITDCIPTLVEPDPHAAYNVVRTTFETDRLPPEWLAHLARFDEIWVPSQQNVSAFRRSGVPPERLRLVPSCYDETVYRPEGPRIELPEALRGRFVFLSVFDWQLRKGWDVLLRAYCQEFSRNEGVGLLLKITRSHGHTLPIVRGQADDILGETGDSLIRRPEIVITDAELSAEEMAALYRSVQAFVLPSRGEGWGRPYLEALACGLPVIGTRHLGSDQFLTDENAVRIAGSLVPISEAAAREIPPYRGHQWVEPDLQELRQAMQRLVTDAGLRQQLAAAGARESSSHYGLASGRQAVESEITRIEGQLVPSPVPPPAKDAVRTVLEGEFFAHHSFANVNEQLAIHLAEDERVALRLHRVQHQPVYDHEIPHAWKLRPYLSRSFEEPPQITIRHAFPPNWQPLPAGKWVHIQPWEFGHLPVDWIEPLQRHVDEVWVPSQYVERVFIQSGIPSEKIRVIPWGVDPNVFAPEAEPLLLPTDKTFRFLYVGGLISRKGFDTLLAAYLQEFGPSDDVCLVVKELGSQTFYRYGNFRESLLAAQADPRQPKIVALDQPFTAGQLASLYTACDCLAAPYRAEGFGLPILEGMACGLAPLVTAGGAADDFTSAETAYLVPGREVPTTHDWQLCGPPLEFEVSVDDVRAAMRRAYEDRELTRRLGQAASQFVRAQFTWRKTVQQMAERLRALAQDERPRMTFPDPEPAEHAPGSNGKPQLGACLISRQSERQLPFALAQWAPFVDELVVVVVGNGDRSAAIAREYGAQVVELDDGETPALREAASHVTRADWHFWTDLDDRIDERDAERLRSIAGGLPAPIHELQLDLTWSNLAVSDLRPDGKFRLYRNGASKSLTKVT
ncbi:MAG: glycosyltransferase [Pirellulaceae bacterium]|nr:glycosyltransferase [Pirellulaceae bacterium]